jgi:hypothetical protein
MFPVRYKHHLHIKGCAMLRIPHSLGNRLTDGGDVSQTHRPPLFPHKHFSASSTNICYRLSNPQGLVLPEGLGKLIKFSYLIGSQTRDLRARTIIP